MTFDPLMADDLFREEPFPASKSQLARRAQDAGAEDDFLTALLGAEQDEFHNVAEVMRALGDQGPSS